MDKDEIHGHKRNEQNNHRRDTGLTPGKSTRKLTTEPRSWHPAYENLPAPRLEDSMLGIKKTEDFHIPLIFKGSKPRLISETNQDSKRKNIETMNHNVPKHFDWGYQNNNHRYKNEQEQEEDLEPERLPSRWGAKRTDIQTEFASKADRNNRPRPVPPHAGSMDLSERYKSFAPPSELALNNTVIVCQLFNDQRRYSAQEPQPWESDADKYAHELPESVQRKQFVLAKRSKYGPDGKSRRMRIQELKNKALENIIFHGSFEDIKTWLIQEQEGNLKTENVPNVPSQRRVPLLDDCKKHDHTGENITQRQSRLMRENMDRQRKNLHDLEVIFDMEIAMPELSRQKREYNEPERQTKVTNLDVGTEISPVDDGIAETFWAVVKIDLHKDGSKVYEIKTPTQEKPNCPIPQATHRHFVVSPDNIFN